MWQDCRTMAWVADVLTASRVVLALVIGIAVATDRLSVAILVLMIAWLTDTLDGMIARASSGTTRLGDWDFRVDVSLGIAILVGLAIADRAPLWLVVGVIGLLAGWTWVTGNPAPAMLMMAVAYGWFLPVLLIDKPSFWWMPFVAIPVLLALDWRRFFTVILPAFFKGAARIGSDEAPEVAPVLDRWA
jgi:phosphatidylglycerophosphate synthase